MIKSIKINLLNICHRLQLHFAVRDGRKKLIIYDIDNTIADTWNYLTPGKQTSNTIFRNLPFFPNFKGKILTEFENPSCQIFFFTVRPVGAWFTTLKWLTKHSLPVRWHNLLFFTNAAHKIDLLQIMVRKGFQITFVDDMSYNHENGKILFYSEEIEKLKSIELTYIGAEAIIALQNDSK